MEHHGGQEAQREKMPVQAGCLFSLLSFSLWDSDVHIQGGSSPPLVNPLWRCFHRHTPNSALLISNHVEKQDSASHQLRI